MLNLHKKISTELSNKNIQLQKVQIVYLEFKLVKLVSSKQNKLTSEIKKLKYS